MSYEMSKNVVYIYRYPHIPWWYRRHDWLLETHSITLSTQKTKSKVHSQNNMYDFSKRKISQFNFGFRVDAEDFRQKNWVIRQSRKYFVWDSCTKWNVRFNIGCWHSIYVDSKILKYGSQEKVPFCCKLGEANKKWGPLILAKFNSDLPDSHRREAFVQFCSLWNGHCEIWGVKKCQILNFEFAALIFPMNNNEVRSIFSNFH